MVEVTICVQHDRIVPDRAGGNQTIDTGSNGHTRASRLTKQGDRVIEDGSRQRIIECCDVTETGGRDGIRLIVIKTLQHFLDDRQARNDRVSPRRNRKLCSPAPTQKLDPRTGVDEDHL